ncbi:MAG: dehydrogenase E1 component subunit alpha/beta [Myxococcales bacterium]|nr:dehydrogenase E1 component subunit alpha/beta [Myxococcales bacterium]
MATGAGISLDGFRTEPRDHEAEPLDLTRTLHSKYAGLSPEKLVEMYRLIYLSRRLDDQEIALKRQNKTFFQISGAGHEVPGVVAGSLMDPGKDWAVTYYRDRALALTLGMTAEDLLLQAVGSIDDPSSGGRQMPSHYGHADLNILTSSSPTGTQFLHATGAAQVGKIAAAVEQLQGVDFAPDELVYVSTGEGATSEGEFWEAMNTISNLKLPVLMVVQDNGYAISVPVEVQTAGGSISSIFKTLPDLMTVEVDGCDVIDTHRGMARAVHHIRSGKGPALVHAHVIRPYSHSMSDNDTLYRTDKERAAEEARDPLHTFAEFLVQEQILTKDEVKALKQKVDDEVREAADAALAAPAPPAHSAEWYVYSPDVDPCSDAFSTEPYFKDKNQRTMVDLLNSALKAEMARDPRIIVFGEDVADVSREEFIEDVKGKGGVFKVTHGLQREFGGERVFNSPLAEANIVGRAIGMATRGLKPVVEIQFFDYIWPAYQQIRNELAIFRWRSNNTFKAPVVIRVPIGGYLKGGAPYHSQSGEVLFTHIPGLRVVMPSTALDANGLLRTAIRCDDPVLFLEPKHLYRQTYNKSPDPGSDYMIPFGKAKTVREGKDLSIITYGSLVQRSIKAAAELEREGISVEILDLRSLNPYDWDAIKASVMKTSKVIVAHEDCLSWGFGSEIVSRIADELFEYLDGPVRRIGALDTFVAYNPDLEEAILPQVTNIIEAARALAAY